MGEFNMNWVKHFIGMLDYCSLEGLGFSGSKFTWAKMCRNDQFFQQRHDRIVANLDWIIKFPDAMVLHLPRIKSDHCYLLISLNGNFHEYTIIPFKLETMWLDHPKFKNMVAKTWSCPMNNHQYATSIFPNKEKEWNKHIFDNIFFRKKNP